MNDPISIPAVLSVKQLADALGQPVTSVIAKLMGFGVLATINEDVDFDTAAIVADDFGLVVQLKKEARELAREVVVQDRASTVSRPPVVTIMGHVDHGKTTLLDTIRKANVAAGEAGGITQHISSYQIKVTPKGAENGRIITFLDTPGHSAFEAMRRHGAQITDLVVLVVAADDGVKPQTVEAIYHAKAMKVPLMVAINKIDKPGADSERVRRELAEYDLVPEEWGGKTVMVPISALQKTGIDELLEVVLLSTDLRDLRANLDVPAVGVVIESHQQAGVGAVATVLIQNGTLRVADFLAIGEVTGKVRTLTDHRGKKMTEATPSMPVEISGLSALPSFGEQMVVCTTEKEAKESARQFVRGQTAKRATVSLGSSAHHATQKEGQKNILNLIVKADTIGSLEAIRDTIRTMRNDDVEVRIVSDGVGDISEGDITMGRTARALVVGFQVRLPAVVKAISDREAVPVSLYSVVYELFDAIRGVLVDLMPEITVEKQQAEFSVLARFRDNRKHVVLGGQVEQGGVQKGYLVKVVRKKHPIALGSVVAVRRGKDEVKTVNTGSQCGLELNLTMQEEPVAVGDTVILYIEQQEKKALGL
jgi:translation initiation factor IF-2